MKAKLALLLLVFCSTIQLAKAQNWGGGIDDEDFNWGFSFQYISAEYKVWKAPGWQNGIIKSDGNLIDPLTSIASKPASGFAVGFVFNRRITKNLDIRLTPALAFSDRLMEYSYAGTTPSVIPKKTKATMLDFPLSLKLKSEKLMNFRAYILGGLKYSIDIASNKDDSSESDMQKFVFNKKNFLSYEAGIGFDLYFEYFKMSPELKLSYSFKDIIDHRRNVFDTPIDRAKLRHFTFSLFFE